MPSGHTSRAFFLLVVFLQNAHSPFPFFGIDTSGLLAPVLALWAAGVGWSRVVLGKHYLFDVLAGAALGLSVAMSPYPSCPPRGLIRILLASAFTIEVIVVALNPKWRAMMRGWPFLLAIVVVFWCTFPFAE